MREKPIKYPIGIQSLDIIRTEGYLYVDKTELIYELAQNVRYAFLSRPRRFGKSLLLSTLQAYFEGRRELFEGLAIEELESQWRKHPVIRIDFTGESYESWSKIEEKLELILGRYEAIYGRNPNLTSLATRFSYFIEQAHQQTGQLVVVLIDEYDKPLLDNIHDDGLYEQVRIRLQGFYSVLKASLQALFKRELGKYWFRSGTPSFLIKILRRYDYPLDEIEGSQLSESELNDITNPETNYKALFFQTGYLTIKDYDKEFDLYTLGFPNEEVRSGFWDVLYRDYLPISNGENHHQSDRRAG